uniref:Death domain-containing protein n=1 Tax=Strigamia maritima TaxID=126957 RepID=T1JGG4_STRMM
MIFHCLAMYRPFHATIYPKAVSQTYDIETKHENIKMTSTIQIIYRWDGSLTTSCLEFAKTLRYKSANRSLDGAMQMKMATKMATAENSFEAIRKFLSDAVVKSIQDETESLSVIKAKLSTVHTNETETDRKSLIDQSFRDVLSQAIIKDAQKPFYEAIISLAISACHQDLCNATLPVILLADLFDCQTINVCEELFEFVEKRVDTWKEDLFFNNTKNNLLRMCNDLLRRLSRSQNTVFCGRILLFLAKFFPLSERSGLNIVSEFNLDNHTVFMSKDDISMEIGSDNEEMVKVEEKNASENSISVDYNLYRKFWTLQDTFCNPTTCYSKFTWKTFTSYASDVLAAFGSFKLDDIKRVTKKFHLSSDESNKQVYFAKYLTNQKLLDLQLSDHNFRRYVLLQFLILFQYLPAQVKFKGEAHNLTEDQTAWIEETTQMVYKLLEETPPDGAVFAKTIQHILSREEYWNKWKNDGCPEFQSSKNAEVDKIVVPQLRKCIQTEILEAAAQGKTLIGNSELTRLWNLCPDNMDACRSEKRDFLPSLEEFFKEDIESNSDELDEPPTKKKYDGNHAWRALRLLSRRSPDFFTSSNQPIRELGLYLQTMIKRVAKKKPTTNVEEGKNDTPDKEEVGGAADESEEELLENAEEKKEESQNTQFKEDSENLQFSPHAVFSADLITSIAREVAPNWKKLATQLSCEEDEVTYFETNNAEPIEQARNMLIVWTERDEASPEVLASGLRAVGHSSLAETLEAAEANVAD